MSYFAYLTQYEYGPILKNFSKVLNIGWLDKVHPYRKGKIVPELLGKLKQLMDVKTINITAGFHICPFCTVENSKSDWGNGEIWIKGKSSIAYVAPVLVVHYIEAHEYLPPKEFLEALAEE